MTTTLVFDIGTEDLSTDAISLQLLTPRDAGIEAREVNVLGDIANCPATSRNPDHER
jgi:hypothetical protein